MVDYVIDTNVWVMASKSPGEAETLAELECIEICRDWLRVFAESDDRLVIDISYHCMREYRRQIPKGSRARLLLNELEQKPRSRILDVQIEFDEDNHAVVPPKLAIKDEDDRKWIAVALAHEPIPKIVSATETDWAEEMERFADSEITIIELCPDYIAEHLKA